MPVLITGIGNTVCLKCLILKKPLVNYIGEKGCKLYSMFILAHNMSLIIGGAGMAVYRLTKALRIIETGWEGGVWGRGLSYTLK